MSALNSIKKGSSVPLLFALGFFLANSFIASVAMGATEGESELSSKIDDGKFILGINLSTGVYVVEYSDNMVNWFQHSIESSDGFPFQIADEISSSHKFFKVSKVSLANPSYSSGFFMTELFDSVSIVQLRLAFSLPDTIVKSASLDLVGLNKKTLSDRLYLAAILSLSKIAEDIENSIPAPYAGLDQDIADAIILDLSDGKLDGKNSNATIQIGTTGETLDSKISNEVVTAAFEHAQNHTAGIKNVHLDATAQTGVFTMTVPAVWSCFYWDSATWQ